MIRNFCLIAFMSLALGYDNEKPHYNLEDAPNLFEKFRIDYNRVYDDEADRDIHYQAFVNTLKRINIENAQSDSAVFDINRFADYTPEEMEEIMGLTPKKKDKKKKKSNSEPTPSAAISYI